MWIKERSIVLLIGKSLRRKNMGNGKRVKRKKAAEKMLEEDFMMQNLEEPRIETSMVVEDSIIDCIHKMMYFTD